MCACRRVALVVPSFERMRFPTAFSRSVRATDDERTRPLPGDELIPSPIGSFTYAITVRRPRREVWPWLVQMGAGSRAGWYSYDVIDNGRRRSAERIVPALQTIAVGALFPASPSATEGFHVLKFEIGSYLVLGWGSETSATPIMTWAFVLKERSDGRTRLIVRARGGREYPFYGLPPFFGMPFIRVVHFIMQRRQLLGIASRVESSHWIGSHSQSEAA